MKTLFERLVTKLNLKKKQKKKEDKINKSNRFGLKHQTLDE